MAIPERRHVGIGDDEAGIEFGESFLDGEALLVAQEVDLVAARSNLLKDFGGVTLPILRKGLDLLDCGMQLFDHRIILPRQGSPKH